MYFLVGKAETFEKMEKTTSRLELTDCKSGTSIKKNSN